MKPEDTYDTYGNAHITWFESAMDLLTASAELKRQVKASVLKTGIPFSRSQFPRLMLRAFALECLIKCHFLRSKKGKLCIGGKYVGVVKSERHDLVKLARSTGLPMSAEEEHVLDRLSAVAVSVGRYPIHKRFDGPKKSGTNTPLQIQWSEPADEATFQSMIRRLVTPIDTLNMYSEMLKDA